MTVKTQTFEHILLKKLIYNGTFFGKVMPILQSKFFGDIGNQELFKLVQLHYKEYKEIPTLTSLIASVKNVSNQEIRSEIISNLQTIAVTEEVPNVEFLCDETVSWVKDSMYLESLQIGSDGLMKKDDTLKLKAKQIMEEMSKVSIDSELGLDFDNIDAMIAYYSERNIGIRTQHKELNKRLGAGFLPGTLSIICASAGVGKSLLMTDIISGIIQKNKNILLVSLEMSQEEVMKRVHANAMKLPINSLFDLNKTEGELKALDRTDYVTKEQIIAAYNKLKLSGTCGKLFIKDYPAGSFTPLMLEQLVESYKIEQNIEFDIVFIDYLGLMKSDLVTPAAGLYSYLKSIGEETRSSARKLNVPIISANQLNRGAIGEVESTDNSNISDSIGTLMTADFILFLLQNDEMKEQKEMVCKITKNRFTGITDTWMMGIDYEHMSFKELLKQDPTDINEITDSLVPTSNTIDDDFGIITAKKQEKAETYVKEELHTIRNADIANIEKADAKLKKDPFQGDSLNELYKDLGI